MLHLLGRWISKLILGISSCLFNERRRKEEKYLRKTLQCVLFFPCFAEKKRHLPTTPPQKMSVVGGDPAMNCKWMMLMYSQLVTLLSADTLKDTTTRSS